MNGSAPDARAFRRHPRTRRRSMSATVMHARLKPVAHRFSYRVFNLLIDLDRLGEADRASRLFSVNRANLLSFHETGPRPRRRRSLRALCRTRCLRLRAWTSRAAACCCSATRASWAGSSTRCPSTSPTTATGTLAAVIYEVRNTFGEMHSYVAPVRGRRAERRPACSRTGRKQFYVSPFNGMAMRYLFRLRPPTDDIAIRILETDAEGPLLSATFNGVRKALTTFDASVSIGAHPVADREGGRRHPLGGACVCGSRACGSFRARLRRLPSATAKMRVAGDAHAQDADAAAQPVPATATAMPSEART